jgi:beta-mannosidase
VNAGGAGDQHYWDVWHGRGDWVHYADSTGRFVSEFGFASAPGHAALRRMSPGAADPLALPVRDRAARWHDKTARGYEPFLKLVALHYPEPADLSGWSYVSQLNQRDALRHGIEHWRRSAFCRGALVWQLNDCWPVQSWSVVDSEGELKAAAHELRRLYAPALLSLVVEQGRARLWAVLDNAGAPLDRVAKLTAHAARDGRVLQTWTAEVKLLPGERRPVLEADLAGFSPEETLVAAELLELPATRTVRLLAEPRAMRLADPGVRVRAGPGQLEVVVDAPAVDLFLWDDGGGLRFLDNYVTLPTPGRAVLRTEGTSRGALRARSLRGEHVVRAA